MRGRSAPESTRKAEQIATGRRAAVPISGVYRVTPEEEWHSCHCHIWEFYEVRQPQSGGDERVVDVITACAYCGAPRCEAHDFDAMDEISDQNRCLWERHHQLSPRDRQHEFPSGRIRKVGA